MVDVKQLVLRKSTAFAVFFGGEDDISDVIDWMQTVIPDNSIDVNGRATKNFDASGFVTTCRIWIESEDSKWDFEAFPGFFVVWNGERFRCLSANELEFEYERKN